ncbi:MAG: Rpn family recombination-promoting nuclease/putative transposase [Myxococcota bacterium]
MGKRSVVMLTRVIYRRDALFKAVAKQPEVYRQIIRKYLPSKLLTKLDCEKAHLVNTSTVDGHLRERIADIAVAVTACPTGKQRAFLMV